MGSPNLMDRGDGCNTTNLDECQYLDHTSYSMAKFREKTPNTGSYFNEADFFEPDFQEAYWGMETYNKLLEAKKKWDPNGLFYCHQCVGSEDWEEGGMCRARSTTYGPTSTTSNPSSTASVMDSVLMYMFLMSSMIYYFL